MSLRRGILENSAATRFVWSLDTSGLAGEVRVCEEIVAEIEKARPLLRSWINFPLLSRSGNASDLDLQPYEGLGKPTPHLQRLPQVQGVLESLRAAGFFILYARIAVLLHRDVLRPHVDTYPAARLLLPLNESGTDFRHVFGDECVAMRPGELWGVDGSIVHGAANVGSQAVRILLLIDASLNSAPSWFDEPWRIPRERIVRRRRWTQRARGLLVDQAHRTFETKGLEAAERSMLLWPFEYDLETASIYAEIIAFLETVMDQSRDGFTKDLCCTRIERLRNPHLKFEIQAGTLPDFWEALEEKFDSPPEPPPYEGPQVRPTSPKNRTQRKR